MSNGDLNAHTQELHNFRPVSNLSFISKIIEKAVHVCLKDHLSQHDLFDTFQSAYRQHYSTETALLQVTDKLRCSIDQGNVAALVMLDLSAAFDTVDHTRLLTRLEQQYGLEGRVLQWIASYLSDRQQSVLVGRKRSPAVPVSCGVPQGSVLGPVLFVLYTGYVSNIVSDLRLSHHSYADDTQLLDTFKPSEVHDSLERIAECTQHIKSWMTSNMLKLNDTKTEALLIGTRQQLCKVHVHSVKVADADINLSSVVKNLGVHLDSSFSFEAHVNQVSKTCFLHLRAISNIRQYLTPAATQALVRALVTSKLDYCNSIFSGLSSNLIDKLQKIQNTSARIITKTPRRAHITPVLKELHWLPVKLRIDFKILCLTYKCLHGSSPSYLSDLLNPYVPVRSLRSNTENLLVVPPYKLKSFGFCSFSYTAPVLWNALPSDIKDSDSLDSFKAKLKTYLFSVYFS